MKKYALLAFPLLLILGCKSNDAVIPSDIKYIDLSHEADQNKAREQYWIVEKRKRPTMLLAAVKSGQAGCSELIIGIGSDGKMTGYKVTKSYPKGLFDKSIAAALGSWRWKPSASNTERKPILTKMHMYFQSSNAKNKAEAELMCGSTAINNS